MLDVNLVLLYVMNVTYEGTSSTDNSNTCIIYTVKRQYFCLGTKTSDDVKGTFPFQSGFQF